MIYRVINGVFGHCCFSTTSEEWAFTLAAELRQYPLWWYIVEAQPVYA